MASVWPDVGPLMALEAPHDDVAVAKVELDDGRVAIFADGPARKLIAFGIAPSDCLRNAQGFSDTPRTGIADFAFQREPSGLVHAWRVFSDHGEALCTLSLGLQQPIPEDTVAVSARERALARGIVLLNGGLA